MSTYIFDNAAPQASQRFASLETLYDPWTICHLEAIGIGPGWHCWEVGAGSGSIVRWIAERCGPTGHILVTDIDPRFLFGTAPIAHAPLEIHHHDIGIDPLPAQSFDLIHARLVLFHVPAHEQALQRLVTALKPGGWLCIDDYDRSLIDRSYPTTNAEANVLYQNMFATLDRLGTELVSAPPSAWPARRWHGGVPGGVEGQVPWCQHDACELRADSGGGHERRLRHR
jgi:ubiquinone/menaquinone biosynthesis C-methylase UbiE